MTISPGTSQSGRVGPFDKMVWLLTVGCLASGTKTGVECCRLVLTPSFYSDWFESKGIAVTRTRICHVVQAAASKPLWTLDCISTTSNMPLRCVQDCPKDFETSRKASLTHHQAQCPAYSAQRSAAEHLRLTRSKQRLGNLARNKVKSMVCQYQCRGYC